MNCQSLFSEKNSKTIISLSSDIFAKCMQHANQLYQGFIQVFWEKAPGQNWKKIIDKTPKLGTQFHLRNARMMKFAHHSHMKLIVNSWHAMGIFSRWKNYDIFLYICQNFLWSNLTFFKIGSDVEISESDPVLLSGLADACWVWPSSDSGLESDLLFLRCFM